MFVEVNGVELYYDRVGSGPDLVMLHGNGEDHTIFEQSVFHLKNHFTVHLLDSRGHGRSSPVSEFHYSDMADDVVAFMSEVGLERPMLCGFSDGGIIGLMIAHSHPDLLSRLYVCGANTDPSTLKGFGMFLCRTLPRYRNDPKVRMMLTEPHITREDLSRITIPVMVIAGSRDAVDGKDTRFIADSIRDSTLCIVKGATHSSYVDGSPQLAQLILSDLGITGFDHRGRV